MHYPLRIGSSFVGEQDAKCEQLLQGYPHDTRRLNTKVDFFYVFIGGLLVGAVIGIILSELLYRICANEKMWTKAD